MEQIEEPEKKSFRSKTGKSPPTHERRRKDVRFRFGAKSANRCQIIVVPPLMAESRRVDATFFGTFICAAARTRSHSERREARHRDDGLSRRVLSLPLERVRAVPFVGIDGRPVCGGGLVKPRGLERLFSVSLRRVKKQARCRRHVSRGWRPRREWIAETLSGRLAARDPPRGSVRASFIRFVGPGGARQPSCHAENIYRLRSITDNRRTSPSSLTSPLHPSPTPDAP